MKRIKYIFKQCLPPFLYKLCRRFSKTTKKNEELTPLPVCKNASDKLVIIGNGPSLNTTMLKYKDVITESNCLMVNEAALTDLYDMIKPVIYMLVDPKFYEEKGYELYKDTLSSLVEEIVTETKWDMTIVMPCRAKKSYAVERFKENSNLNVVFYEDGLELPENVSLMDAWDKNLISPPAQTVLNTAVWLSIYWGYKSTYIVGADTSWHTQLQMDQYTNELYTEDNHFFDNKKIYNKEFDSECNRRVLKLKLHEELFAEANALKSYWELRKYADWKGVRIYNASEYSWIDAFERKKIE